MKNRRLRDNKDKFVISKKGSIEENIKQLESELGVISGGAPNIEGETENKIRQVQKEKEFAERADTSERFASEKEDEIDTEGREEDKYPEKPAFNYKFHAQERHDYSKPFYKNEKIYIFLFAVLSLILLLTKAPIFRYATPFRQDPDLPEIQVAFKYYNNILGQQRRQETIISTGVKTVNVPIPMVQWMNLDKEKKLLVVREYMPL